MNRRLLVHGLSILEVMLAILIIGVSVTTLLSLQGVLSRGVFTAHALVDRIPYIKSFFVEADRDRLFEQEKGDKKVIENPSLTMTYSLVKPASKTLQAFKNLEVETVNAQYPTVFGTRTETFAQLRFHISPEKK